MWVIIFFPVVISGIWADKRGEKREFQLRAEVGFHVSMEEQSGILTCFMNWPTPTHKLPWLGRFQVMNGHNSVACQVLLNVSIIVWLHMLVSIATEWMKSSSPIVIIFIDFWHQWHLLISDIFDASVSILTSRSFLTFRGFRAFPELWPVWAHQMAVTGIFPFLNKRCYFRNT